MKGLFLPFCLLASAIPALASPITPTITSSAGTSYNAPAISQYHTTNFDMIGSKVTVTYGNGATSTATWNGLGAYGSGWSLTEFGDTFTSAWTLTSSVLNAAFGVPPIVAFSFDGVSGNTSFDIVSSPYDSPGSSSGKKITDVNGPAGLTMSVLYTNRLLVNNMFYGDEYTKMIATLGGRGLLAGQSLSFVTDTDNATSKAVPPAVTPEPSSLMLLGTGLLTVGAAARRRFTQA